jgi:hypothetical protein
LIYSPCKIFFFFFCCSAHEIGCREGFLLENIKEVAPDEAETDSLFSPLVVEERRRRRTKLISKLRRGGQYKYSIRARI